MCGETYYLWSAVDSDLASRELRTRPELGFPPTPDQATPVLLVLSFQSVLVRLRVSSLGIIFLGRLHSPHRQPPPLVLKQPRNTLWR